MNTLNFRIVGDAPLLQHNGHLVNPMNKFAKKLKELSSNRTKTDEIRCEMMHVEFLGGLYVDERKHPCIPGELIEACCIAGAKKLKMGGLAKIGIFCEGLWPLKYKGPTKPDALWHDEKFRFVVPVRIQQNRVMRCRPIFREWELEFTLLYDPDTLSEDQVTQIVKSAGAKAGIGDWRPRFGRFSVVNGAKKKAKKAKKKAKR